VLDDGLELGRRLAVAAGAEERAAERLAHRGLVGLELAGARQGTTAAWKSPLSSRAVPFMKRSYALSMPTSECTTGADDP
jgi:hypothetical protein